MEIIPIVSDSLGVRSLCVYVSTTDINILIDPSAALCPNRYGLPPTSEEIDALHFYKEKIREYALKTDLFIISHYHYDHYDPEEIFYEGKWVIAKDPSKNINKSQKTRGLSYWNAFRNKCRLEIADSNSYEYGSTSVEFSAPVPHGPPKTPLGFVIMTSIECGSRKFLHASDVQGPILQSTTDEIINRNPDIVVIDGPPTYLLNTCFSRSDLNLVKKNLIRIAENVDILILDHHLLRDLHYRSIMREVYRYSNVLTFAEFLGKDLRMLEAKRKFVSLSSRDYGQE